jgi:putative ABC transport system permease protein
MPLFEALRMALETLRTQKLKSFFSLLGVLIGVTFLIAVVSIVQGMNVYMEDEFANRLVGLNTFQVRRTPSINMGDVSDETWREWRRRPQVDAREAAYLESRLDTPALFSRLCDQRTSVSVGGRSAADIEIVAADPAYFLIKSYEFAAGRPFTPQEAKAGLPVIVLGFDVADGLFPGVDAIGRSVTVGELPYRVIGVVARQGTLFGMSLD